MFNLEGVREATMNLSQVETNTPEAKVNSVSSALIIFR